MDLDNRITPKPIDQIVKSHESSAEFMCISCYANFWVYSGALANQTLFCTNCMNHLQKAIIREKQQNYGW